MWSAAGSPEVDIRTAAEAGLATLEDYEVLRLAAEANRILISQTAVQCRVTSTFCFYVSESRRDPPARPCSYRSSHRMNCFSSGRLAIVRSGSTAWHGFLYGTHVGRVSRQNLMRVENGAIRLVPRIENRAWNSVKSCFEESESSPSLRNRCTQV